MGSTEQFPCFVGYSCVDSGNTSSGFPRGTELPTEIPPPPPGVPASDEGTVTTCRPGLQSVGQQCVPCPRGHYCQGGIAIKCDAGFWHDLIGADSVGSCISCPSEGTECTTGYSLEVLEGYWMADANQTSAYSCPRRTTCVGGAFNDTRAWVADTSCMEGHEGPLCGRCQDGFYRGKFECLSCADLRVAADGDIEASKRRVVSLMISAAVSTMAAILVYLLFPKEGGGKKTQILASTWASTLGKVASLFSKLVGKEFLTIIAAIFKVLISYTQCLSTINRFPMVKWPLLFINFIKTLDVFNVEFLSMFPAECITGSRLGFFTELVVILAVSLCGHPPCRSSTYLPSNPPCAILCRDPPSLCTCRLP